MYARADTIVKHPELMKRLKEAGFGSLTVGFESYNDNQLKKLNKKASAEVNHQAILTLKKLGINFHSQFIVDPGFSREDFDELFQYVYDKCIGHPIFPVLTPLPGTELYKETCEQLVIKNYDYYDFAHSVLPTKLDRKEFYRQVVRLYARSYSFKRYFHYKKIQRQKSRENSPDVYAYRTDGQTFLRLFLSHIIPIFQYCSDNQYPISQLYR